jgi:transposase-like protein
MAQNSCKRQRFLAAVTQHADGRYPGFRLSLGDGEEMPAHRSVDVFCETICVATVKSGRMIATSLRHRGPSLSRRWHRDELVSTSPAERVRIRRAVDDEAKARASCARPESVPARATP